MVRTNIAIRALVPLSIVVAAGISACTADPGRATDSDILVLQGIAQPLPLPSWEQANTNGFGDSKELEVGALEFFNGHLYAGTYNLVDPLQLFDGARIFRSPDGSTWTAVTQPGFQNPHDSAPPAILDFVVFGNRLYASTGRGGNPAQIWRSSNGVNWAPMVTAGFGDPDIHDIAALTVYNNVIYAGVSSQVSGARIFRSSTGDSNTWNPVTPAAATMPGAGVTGFAEFNGALYATVESEAPVQIWRTSSVGGAWTSVMSNGFGDSNTTSTGGMAVFGGYLYVGARNAVNGAQLWRTKDGASWTQAIDPGFGDSNNQKVEMVFVFQNQLYISLKNAVTGLEVWRSTDGTVWERVNPDGFGDRDNTGTNRSHATAEFLSQLYVGTSNTVNGAELWRMLGQLTVTPTITATDTPTLTATDTPTDTPAPTATPLQTQIPTDTPTNTATATETPTLTATDTPTHTQTPTDTPTPSPTETPTPLSSTPGKVTGGGTIDSEQGGLKATFGFTISYSASDAAPAGNLVYQDHQSNLRLKATAFDLLVVEGNHAWFTGMGMLDDGRIVSFTVEIHALSKPGAADMFSTSIPTLNGYTAGGTLSGGNITIH